MIRKIDIQQKRASQDGRFLWVTDFGDNNYCSVRSTNIPFMTQEIGATFWADVTEKTNKKGETYFMVDKAAATEEELQPEPEIPPEQKQKASSPEVGMCWNNIGAGVRDGSIERDFPHQVVSIKSQYYRHIFKTAGITTKED